MYGLDVLQAKGHILYQTHAERSAPLTCTIQSALESISRLSQVNLKDFFKYRYAKALTQNHLFFVIHYICLGFIGHILAYDLTLSELNKEAEFYAATLRVKQLYHKLQKDPAEVIEAIQHLSSLLHDLSEKGRVVSNQTTDLKELGCQIQTLQEALSKESSDLEQFSESTYLISYQEMDDLLKLLAISDELEDKLDSTYPQLYLYKNELNQHKQDQQELFDQAQAIDDQIRILDTDLNELEKKLRRLDPRKDKALYSFVKQVRDYKRDLLTSAQSFLSSNEKRASHIDSYAEAIIREQKQRLANEAFEGLKQLRQGLNEKKKALIERQEQIVKKEFNLTGAMIETVMTCTSLELSPDHAVSKIWNWHQQNRTENTCKQKLLNSFQELYSYLLAIQS